MSINCSSQASASDTLQPISLLSLVQKMAPALEKEALFTGYSLQASAKMSDDSFITSQQTKENIDHQAPFLKATEYISLVTNITTVASILAIPVTVALAGIPAIVEMASEAVGQTFATVLQTMDTMVQTVQDAVSAGNGAVSASCQMSLGATSKNITNSKAATQNLTQNSSSDAKLMNQTSSASQAVAGGIAKLIGDTSQAQRAYKV